MDGLATLRQVVKLRVPIVPGRLRTTFPLRLPLAWLEGKIKAFTRCRESLCKNYVGRSGRPGRPLAHAPSRVSLSWHGTVQYSTFTLVLTVHF